MKISLSMWFFVVDREPSLISRIQIQAKAKRWKGLILLSGSGFLQLTTSCLYRGYCPL